MTSVRLRLLTRKCCKYVMLGLLAVPASPPGATRRCPSRLAGLGGRYGDFRIARFLRISETRIVMSKHREFSSLGRVLYGAFALATQSPGSLRVGSKFFRDTDHLHCAPGMSILSVTAHWDPSEFDAPVFKFLDRWPPGSSGTCPGRRWSQCAAAMGAAVRLRRSGGCAHCPE